MFVIYVTLSFLHTVNKDFPQSVAQGSDDRGESPTIDVFAEIGIRTPGLETTI